MTSIEKLNLELGWETIQLRAKMLGLNIFHKIHLNETRPLISKCMPKLDTQRPNILRSNGGYLPFDNNSNSLEKSFFPNISKLWNSLERINRSKNLHDFKLYTKISMKPPKYKFYSRGNKFSNTLLTNLKKSRQNTSF